jgi:hypothetical protein
LGLGLSTAAVFVVLREGSAAAGGAEFAAVDG